MSWPQPTSSAPIQLAGYRWLLDLATQIDIDSFDFEMALRLWTETAGGLYCCDNCGDDTWCARGLDYWMAGIMIFLFKFYGHGRLNRTDRMYIRFIRSRYLDSPENRAEMIAFELELMDLLMPVLFRIQNDVGNVENDPNLGN